ncbi:hypothetical protein Bca52824_076454 [Brassica carinata]|uniref:Tify domain-containing protein n=1 Tax=Brassica carinata TaxID=52824 RepID=A0A8X7TWC6_BRACI|nr:hypothetical protein Bca52824_076454 [Brassica carinata]
MSSSMECSDSAATRRFSRKPSFSLTCSRLSQYLKENGSFGDLSLGMSCKPEVNGNSTTTMSLFPCEAAPMATVQEVKPKNLFSRQPSFSSSSSSLPKKEDVLKMTQTTTTRSVRPEPQTAPLTIFYNGEVIVFNDFSAEKAKEVMYLASKGTANSFTGFTSTLNLPKNQTEVRTNIAPTSNQVPHLMKPAAQEPILSSSAAMACELPIARRASLHRFLAKRKDRVTSKAPYQLSDPAKASSKPQTGDNNTTSWLYQELAYDYSPRFRVYKNGQIQRLVAETFVPPSLTPQNGVVSKDAVYSPEKNLSLRIYLPHQTLETSEENNKKKKKLPLLVYFHGGAFIMETAFSPAYNTFLTSTVSAAGCIAFSVDYRRSPEHPIPIPYEDSWDAVKWILTHIAGSGPEDWVNDHADFRRVFVAGDSAGANIAHHMAIRAGEENGSIKISGMTLFHPFFFSKAILEEQEDGVRRYMEGIWEIACPNSEKGVEDPWINVVGSDLSGLECGRVLVMVAGKDVLAREGRVYAEKLEECGWGGRVEVVETEGEDHVFHIRNPDSDNARLLVQRFAEFIRQVCCDENVRK